MQMAKLAKDFLNYPYLKNSNIIQKNNIKVLLTGIIKQYLKGFNNKKQIFEKNIKYINKLLSN